MKQEISINDIVNTLKNVRKGSEKLDPILTSFTDKLSTVNEIVNTVFKLIHDVDICCKAISTLKKIASSLSGVPLIGSIASVICKILEIAQASANTIHLSLCELDKVLKNVDKLLKKAYGGLDELTKCNKMVHDHIPEFTKTLQIIDYIIQMANIVEPIVIGEDVKKRLNTLLTHLENIEKTASVPVNELNNFLEDISDIISSVKNECDNIKEKTKGLTNAIANIGKAVSILKPIGDALNSVINAIAPIKWVLDAADCLINKILKPVIDAILKATGLQKLIDMLSEQLMKLLGIDFIVGILKDQFSKKLLDQLSVISDSFNNMTSKWKKFSDCLDDFSPLKSVDMKAKMKDLLLTVFNGVVDPSKPSPIPDWPDEPDVLDDKINGLEAQARYNKIDWEYPVLSNNYCIDLIFFNKITYQHKEAQLLEEEIGKASPAVNKIHLSLSKYQAKLIVLKRIFDLPAYFTNEIDLLKTYLAFIRDLIDFISKLSTVPEPKKERLNSILRFIQQQIDDSYLITKNISVLQKNINSIVQQQQLLAEGLPSEGSLSEMLTRINSWPISLDHLLDSYELGKEHNPTAEQLVRLESIDKDIKEDAYILVGIVTNINNASQNITKSLEKLDSDIDDGIIILKQFSPEGYILPEKYLDKMQEVAKILHQLDAIFEPLLLLIEVLHEKESIPSENSILDMCQNYLINFTDKLQNQVKNSDWLNLIEAILKQLSPISNILANLNVVNMDLNKVLPRLKTDSETLTGHIQNLITVMNTEKSYKFENEEVSNRFFTQAQVESASKLVKEIVK